MISEYVGLQCLCENLCTSGAPSSLAKGGALQVPRLRSPGFPVKLVGVGEPHAAFPTESRTRSHEWSHVQEIRVGMTKGEGSVHLSSCYMGWRELYAEREANHPSIHITSCRGRNKSTLCHPE